MSVGIKNGKFSKKNGLTPFFFYAITLWFLKITDLLLTLLT